MDTKIRLATLGILTLVFSGSTTSPAAAATIDLTSGGSSGVINGAIYEQITPQTTGTGVIDPFVQQSPQGNGTTSQAYNTTVNNVLDNKSADNFNHSITLAEVSSIIRGRSSYRRFMLDINESSGGGDEFISLDEVQIFVGGTANSNVTSFVAGVLAHDGALVYRMDAGADSYVALDASLNAGSGSGDMFLYVPDSVFVGFPGTAVVTLYSAFGLQGDNPVGFVGKFGGSGGFEEWAAPVPEPTSSLLVVGAALAIGIRRLWRRV